MAIKFCRPTATGSNNGTTWENGYTSLQAAHDACGAAVDADTLFVMPKVLNKQLA